MGFTGYDLMWLFFVYSFLGWIAETVVASYKKGKLVNRGFFTGPFCYIYGFSAVLMTLTLWELENRWFFLFASCMIQATVVEWLTGKLLERMKRQKWWDYSGKRFNHDGYICVQYSLLWGALGFMAMQWGNDLFQIIFHFLPDLFGHIMIWVLAVMALVDMSASMAAVFHVKKEAAVVREWHYKIAGWTAAFGNWIVLHVSRRLENAYSLLQESAQKSEKSGDSERKEADGTVGSGRLEEGIKTTSVPAVFAEGCGFYKLFWLFFTGCLLGDLTETIFCRVTAGVWMSRSSLVWGPFSIVWGLAMAMATGLLYKDKDKADRYLFFYGTFLGGAYEYACSVFTEIAFGKVFWDYSHMPFNLGGRVNLLYCFFWGVAAVIWIKVVYPFLSEWIEKIPVKPGIIITWVLVLFMAVNILVSVAALHRYDARGRGEAPQYSWEQAVDAHFDDARMEKIYPNAVSR